MSLTGPSKCPHCGGTGTIVVTDVHIASFIEILDGAATLKKRRNSELAEAINEVRNYLGSRGVSSWAVTSVLDEVWWRLHAADEPAEVTRAKIEAMSNDQEWLSK